MKLLSGLIAASFLSFMLLLQTGCSDEEDNTLPDVTAAADTIYGTVKMKSITANGIVLTDWNYGPAMVRADKLANAALTSDGTFIMVLPKTVAGSEFMTMSEFIATQGGTCKAAPESTNFVETVQFTVDYTDNGVAKTMAVSLYLYELQNNKPVVSKSYAYNFYDRDGTFTGNSSFGKAYDWTFTKGWGMVESYFSNSTNAYASKTIAAAPANAIWTN
jgi:hypothetical protein